MKKIHNFSAGPSILPAEVLKQASDAIEEYQNQGLSVLEMSHRSTPIENVIEEATELVRDLLNLPSRYKVLFLTGGASSQFYMVPMNLLAEGEKAAYIDTGRWSAKAIKEAKIYGNVAVLNSSKKDGYTYIPKESDPTGDYSYLHITSNNTVAGSQYHSYPTVDYPIVADMSSDIFTRDLEIEKFGLIYAGAQKNMGPAGTTLVIVDEAVLEKVDRRIPTMLDYRTHIKKKSAFNTPPVYAIYVSLLYLRWMKAHGGVKGMRKKSKEKAELLYTEIDRNKAFEGIVATEDRSRMNATFTCKNKEYFNDFLDLCTEAGISGIKGHRSVGGFRASMYNALPLSSVELLVKLMQEYEKKIT